MVESKTVAPGAEFTIPILLKNNPGVANFGLEISYDTQVLEMTKGGEAKDILEVSFSQTIGSPYQITLARLNNFVNSEAIVALLSFKTKDGVTSESTRISVAFKTGGSPYNENDKEIKDFVLVSEDIAIRPYTPGDANDDGEVTPRDATRILQYYNGWKVVINELAADANGDGEITPRDATRVLQAYNGWNVTLGKSAVLSGNFTEEVPSLLSSEDAPRFEIGDPIFDSADSSLFTIPVLLKNNPGISSFGLEISYNTEHLEMTKGAERKDMDVSFSETPGFSLSNYAWSNA